MSRLEHVSGVASRHPRRRLDQASQLVRHLRPQGPRHAGRAQPAPLCALRHWQQPRPERRLRHPADARLDAGRRAPGEPGPAAVRTDPVRRKCLPWGAFGHRCASRSAIGGLRGHHPAADPLTRAVNGGRGHLGRHESTTSRSWSVASLAHHRVFNPLGPGPHPGSVSHSARVRVRPSEPKSTVTCALPRSSKTTVKQEPPHSRLQPWCAAVPRFSDYSSNALTSASWASL